MLTSVTEKITMLYCPKCQNKYKEGTQRFCAADKTRLLAAPSANNSAKKMNGVFSSILSNTLDFENPTVNPEQKPRNFERQKPHKPLTHSTAVKKEQQTKIGEKAAPSPRFIKPSEIPSGTAEIGDRQSNPVGRLAVTAENPNVLLGHTIKGRYSVVGRLRQNENSILFLTKDKLSNDKKAFVRVLLGENEEDDFTHKVYVEERVSLSHLDHPNILRVIDSGELPEGKPFIVSTFVEGKTLADLLLKREQFNALRTARIINQAASALGEAHQNDILHRRLSPEDIILTVSDEGAEQVKLTNFGIFEDEISEQNLAYTAPEQLEGEPPNIAGDIYSLAVIAYQMLTGRLPHNANSARELLNSQREGLRLLPSNVRFDVPPLVDQILQKALSPDASQRYPKARDFGDAFFNAVSTVAPGTTKEEKIDDIPAEMFELDEIETNFVEQPKLEEPEIEQEIPEIETVQEITVEPEENIETQQQEFAPIPMPEKTMETVEINSDRILIPPSEVFEEPEEISAKEEIVREIPAEEPIWKRRSIEAKQETNWKNATLSLFGIIILFAVVGSILYYFANRPPEPVAVVNDAEPPKPVEPVETTSPTSDIEIPPLPRSIDAPPNSVYFQNVPDNLTKELQKNFRGFQLYYPKGWKVNDAEGKFIDISRDATNGLPIEQFMVSPYNSDGTFQKDQDKFAKLVESSNEDLKKILPDYKVVSQGETNINGGWRAYEVKFKNVGEINGKPFTLWGRRLWIPAARPGVKTGLVVTMFATSLSETTKGVDDVGMKGGLGEILYTFEPDQNM